MPQAQVVVNTQGPHYIQGQPVRDASGKVSDAGELLILRPGLNLVDAKKLAEWRKANKGLDSLFSTTIAPSRAVEADPRTFGKPMLEVRAGELPDANPLQGLPLNEAQAIVELTQDTDLLKAWLGSCSPGKQSDLIRVINARIKAVVDGIQA